MPCIFIKHYKFSIRFKLTGIQLHHMIEFYL